MCYNKIMEYKYEVFKLKGKKFVVKLDRNPINNEFEYHMYIRHLIMPDKQLRHILQKYQKYITKNITDMNYTVKN
ncbi:MAG: hypothetical protein LUG16_08930 [Candidatus Gastranaerophilales bacterium]|nr:hypothetical protein [Candidatus Gastranaerophilales bacterium]